MAEYIKLKEALHVLDLVIPDEGIKHKGKAIRKRLKELSTEAVTEVVRCRDCEHYIHVNETEGTCGLTDQIMWYEGFCSDGERKEG